VRVGGATLSEGKRTLGKPHYVRPYGVRLLQVRQGLSPPEPPPNQKPRRTGKMAIAYADVDTVHRTPTTNLVAGVAYILRGRFKDCNSGKVYDFRKIDDPPEYSATFMPPNSRYQNESELWSEAERLERRHDSRLGRRLILALPAEVSPEERQQIVEGIAGKIVERWGCAITAAIHRPGKQGDQRNFHAHFLISSRRFNEEGFLKEKIRILDQIRTSRQEIEWVRQTCQEQINQFLSPEQQLDFRSYKRQGIDRPPQPHYGRKVIAWERKTGQKHEVRLEYEQFVNSWNRQRELEREAERERQRQQQEQERQAELERQKYSYFASTKKLINRYKNPQIGTDREGEILLPDQTLKFSELNGYSLESLQEVYQSTRRKIERDLDRRIGKLPPISRQIIGRCPLKELTDEGLIGLFPTVAQFEQLEKEEQQKREAERKRQEQELERQRQEQERQQQELARAKLAKFKRTQKLLSLSGGETGENWYRFENLRVTEGDLREFSLEQLEKIYQTTCQLAIKKAQELAAKFWNDGEYDRRVWEIHEGNLPLENKLEELLKIRDAVAERSFREINFYLEVIQQFRKDFRIDLDLAKIPKEQIVDLANDLQETWLFYSKQYSNLREEACHYRYIDQVILDFLIRKFELNPSEGKMKELLKVREVQEVGEIQQKIANSLERKFSAETREEPKGSDFDVLIWDYKVKVAEIQERLMQKLQSKGLETSDLENLDLEQLAGKFKEILQREREERQATRERKRSPRSDQSRQRDIEWGW